MTGRAKSGSPDVFLPDLNLDREDLKGFKRLMLLACGTFLSCRLGGQVPGGELGPLPVEVDLGSEFRYRDPLVGPDDLVVAISQSGETADTLAAVKEAKSKGAKALAICNVVGSSLTRECDGVLYTHAGPEIGVASTKAFTTQLIALHLLAIHLGRVRGAISDEEGLELVEELGAAARIGSAGPGERAPDSRRGRGIHECAGFSLSGPGHLLSHRPGRCA
jgi:glucosamine--fructose-6-phosphate aminotransferase (isomerizing)